MKRITPLAESAARQRRLDTASLSAGDERGVLGLRDVVGPATAPLPDSARPRLPTGARGALAAAAERQRGEHAGALGSQPIEDEMGPTTSPSVRFDASHYPPFDRIELTPTRRTIAERLAASKLQAPHYYMSIDVEMDALIAMRSDLNAFIEPQWKLSINDLLLKLVAATLTQQPALNAAWTGDAIARFQRVDLALAVAIDGGLVTPVVRDAAAKGLRRLSSEVSALIDAARARRLTRDAFLGGTFTVSNLGMYGVRDFAAIINPPQAAILAVAGLRRELVPGEDGRAREVRRTTFTLSVDHRIADGVAGAEFLNALAANVEEPRRLLL